LGIYAPRAPRLPILPPNRGLRFNRLFGKPLPPSPPEDQGEGFAHWERVRVFRAAQPTPKSQWRGLGDVIFDLMTHIVDPQEAQMATANDPSIQGAHLLAQSLITDASVRHYNLFWSPHLRWTRGVKRDVVQLLLEAGYRSYSDVKYYPTLYLALVNALDTTYMNGIDREGKGINNLGQIRTLATNVGGPAAQLAWSTDRNIFEATLHAFHNFLTIRSMLAHATAATVSRPLTVPCFQVATAPLSTASGVACGDR